MPFLGEFRHKLDEKNRISVPAKFREELGEVFVVCRAPEKCLFLYPYSEWERVSENIKQRSKTAKERSMQRRALLGASTLEIDKQGRITVSGELCNYAGFSREVVAYGANNRIELWSAEKWDDMLGADFYCNEGEELEIEY